MHRTDFFEILLQTITDGTIIIDTSMTIVYHNKAIASMLGINDQDMVGQHVNTFLSHFDGADMMPYSVCTLPLQEAYGPGTENKPELMALRKPDGSRIWYRMTTDPICRTNPNTVDYIVAIFSNVNDLMDKTFELEANRKTFADLVENVPGVIYQWAEQSDGKYGFTYVSRKMKEYFDLAPEEMNRFADLIPEEDREKWRKTVNESKSTGEPWIYEGRLRYPDGSEKWWRGSSISTKVEQDKRLYNGLLLDITAQRRTQLELETLNAELQQFAFVASHDLQEPLRKIYSFLDLFKMQYFDLIDEEGQHYIDKAIDASVRMRSLITDLLEYSRINREKEIVETDTREVALEVAENFAGKNVEIEIGDLPVIKSLSGQIYRVFQNLFSNGLKYNDNTSKKLKVSARKVGNEWEFTVEDNGIGIAPDSHQEIFTPFKRLHGKNAYSGTGLGLAICRKIVMMHGGRFSVESKPGEGSKFIFTIPENFTSLKNITNTWI